MAYKVIILYRLYMPFYFLGTFTEYPYISDRMKELLYVQIGCQHFLRTGIPFFI